jgi:hypothetical protein
MAALLLAALQARPVFANLIVVKSVAENDLLNCTLRAAIINHNNANQSGSTLCASGSLNDQIVLDPPHFAPDIFLNRPLPAIERGSVELTTGSGFAVTLHGGYFEVDGGAALAITGKISDLVRGFPEFSTNLSMFYVKGGRLTIGGESQTFSNGGLAINPPGYGGVIYNAGGVVELDDSPALSGNAATQAGGAIYNTGGTILLKTNKLASMSDNSAPLGGGIYNLNGSITLPSGNQIRMARNGARDGSCIFTSNGLLELHGLTCEDSAGSGIGRGGGILAEQSRVSIFGSNFNHNSEGDLNGSGLGGAIYTDRNSTLTMDSTACSYNTARAGGCLWTSSPNVTLELVTCRGNTTFIGGCVEMNAVDGLLKISESHLVNNKAGNDGRGGAIAMRGSSLFLSSSDMSSNSAGDPTTGGKGRGGGVFADSDSKLTFDQVVCTANTAADAGGCIQADSLRNTINHSNCSENAAHTGGCVNLSSHAELTMTDSNIRNNRADKSSVGGGIALSDRSTIRISYGEIAGNSAGTYQDNGKGKGGGIFAPDHDTIVLDSVTVAGNTASQLGAGLELDNFSNLDAVNSTFADEGPNDVPEHGVHSQASAMRFVNVTFWNAPLLAEGGTSLGSLRNTILFNSGFCVGKLTDGGYNIQYPKPFPGCTLTIPVIDPKLDPVGPKNNGGPTPTVASLPGSPAIDAIPLDSCTDLNGKRLLIDQRAFPRPDPGDKTLTCDIGAVEFQEHQPKARKSR